MKTVGAHIPYPQTLAASGYPGRTGLQLRWRAAMPVRSGLLTCVVAFLLAPIACGQQSSEADFVIRDFHFRIGEALSELKLHYATVGVPARDTRGRISNAVLLLHGTGGSLGSFLTERY